MQSFFVCLQLPVFQRLLIPALFIPGFYAGAFPTAFLFRSFPSRRLPFSYGPHPIPSAKVQPYTSLTVSLAIASSSFVGITITVVLLSGVEITISSPRFAFASRSRRIPR